MPNRHQLRREALIQRRVEQGLMRAPKKPEQTAGAYDLNTVITLPNGDACTDVDSGPLTAARLIYIALNRQQQGGGQDIAEAVRCGILSERVALASEDELAAYPLTSDNVTLIKKFLVGQAAGMIHSLIKLIDPAEIEKLK